MNVCTGMGRNRPRCSRTRHRRRLQPRAAASGRARKTIARTAPARRRARSRKWRPRVRNGPAVRVAFFSPLPAQYKFERAIGTVPAPSRRACKTNRYRGGLDSTNCPAWLYCRTDMSGLWSAALLSRTREIGGLQSKCFRKFGRHAERLAQLVTPFQEDGSLDEEAFHALVEWQIGQGRPDSNQCPSVYYWYSDVRSEFDMKYVCDAHRIVRPGSNQRPRSRRTGNRH